MILFFKAGICFHFGFLLMTCNKEEESGAICCLKIRIGGDLLVAVRKENETLSYLMLFASDAIVYFKYTLQPEVLNSLANCLHFKNLTLKYLHFKKCKQTGGIITGFSATTCSWKTRKKKKPFTKSQTKWKMIQSVCGGKGKATKDRKDLCEEDATAVYLLISLSGRHHSSENGWGF